jgi:hypothetical protein
MGGWMMIKTFPVITGETNLLAFRWRLASLGPCFLYQKGQPSNSLDD